MQIDFSRILSILRESAKVLNISSDRNEIIYTSAVAITSGDGLSFNRFFYFELEKEILACNFILGPKSPEEANEIWQKLENAPLSELILSYESNRFKTERDKFSDLIDSLKIDFTSDSFLKKSLTERNGYLIKKNNPNNTELDLLLLSKIDSDEIAVAPLCSSYSNYGVILADNAFSKKSISDLSVKLLEVFGFYIGTLFDRIETLKSLNAKVKELEKMNRALFEYKDTMARLEQSATVAEFVNVIFHDIKNSSVAINGLLKKYLEDKKKKNKKVPLKFIEQAGDEAEKLEITIGNFSEFLKKRYLGEVSVSNLNDVVLESIEELTKISDAFGAKIIHSLSEGPLLSLFNPESLKSSLKYVILNAFESVEEVGGGTVKIETNSDDKSIFVKVSDTGKGINDDIREKIFLPFFTTKEKGTGLGLYNTKQILKSFGGNIELIPSEGGEGASFKIWLPRITK